MLQCENRNNTYLTPDSEAKVSYASYLECVLDIISRHATPTQMRKIKSDLQLTGNTFAEAKYLQAACESSVAASIAVAYGDTFEYEPKLNPPSDVDCSFSACGYKFNIEVKCPDYTKYHEHEAKDCYSIGVMGRLDGYFDAFESIKLLLGDEKAVEKQVHMDNKLKDYLLSCQKKFPVETSEKELNILLVCCDSAMDMQKWVHYLYGYKGLLTEGSFIDPNLYSNVDVVILTNLYHRHYSYWQKDKLSEHWSLGKSFNLIFKNRSLQRGKDHAIWCLVDIFPNYSREILDYPLQELEEVTRIPRFVQFVEEKNDEYLFQPRI
ncbi:hypothetical protein AB2359_17470 [Vibrio cholerae]|uniref:hypothetical protein n=1 Tax=Vibrio TaxID=662 RepID=UPI0004E29D3E|nr:MULTISPECIES: hypothetical protein [Vibrio]EIJ0936212.1 hypothetical protein [Vibrio cholerae]KFE25442.1 hypothetical protein DN30_3915 [Vibrio cholerae]MBY7669196.1 hypothetical protein [Vibrio anguillarum]TXY40684.1 hypothetical protein FXE84_19290 [Vibrio cholerae]GHX01730.1 hypothetical protein VCSRO105_3645 [Vibrio cholerae]